jgi:hypothetical protein
MQKRFVFIPLTALVAGILSACGGAPATSAPTSAPVAVETTTAPAEPTAAPAEPTEAPAEATEAPTEATNAPTSEAASTSADLVGIKSYLQSYGKDYLLKGAEDLKTNADAYYDALKAANFDYAAAWGEDGSTLRPLILNMREAFNTSHTGYESVEGIVAGVPSLSEFDTILDAGSPGSEGDPDSVADFNLTLPDGTTLEQPGNFYHNLLEPLVYGTDPVNTKLSEIDVDGDGTIGFGDALPDANLLKGAADGLLDYVNQTNAAIDAWQPSEADAFTAMVTMTPTMDEYFGNWKESRYVSGDASEEIRFVAHSRLVDVSQILGSLRTIYAGVKPVVAAKDAALADQIDGNYAALVEFVDGLIAKEASGDNYSPDEAEVLGQQAQDQAQTITGQVTQAAETLGITLEDE